MVDVNIVVTNPAGVDIGVLQEATLDLAYGTDQNDFELSFLDALPAGSGFGAGSRIYIENSEYGGLVDSIETAVTNGSTTLTYSGRTWQGVLAAKILSPDSGQDYLTATGALQTVLTALVSRIGLAGLFIVDPLTVNPTVNWRFDRYVDAWSGIRKLLDASGLKLTMSYTHGKVHVNVGPIHDWGDTVDSDLLDFTAKRDTRRVNHLIGLGTGELKARAVSHWYADGSGKVSQTQTFTGVDEVVAIYDYSNAAADELKTATQEKLQELQTQGDVDVSLRADTVFDLGDVVSARDNISGLRVSATVTKKIVKIEKGLLTVDYEVGQATSSSNGLSESAESSNGGHAYYAGNGLTLTDYTFDAEVSKTDLDTVSKTATAANTAVSNMSASIGALQESDTAQSTAITKAQSTADGAAGDLTAFKASVSSTYAKQSDFNTLNASASRSFNMAPANGTSHQWYKLGTLNQPTQGRMTKIEVVISAGNNGEAKQNMIATLYIQKGWTGGAATAQYGISVLNHNWVDAQVLALTSGRNYEPLEIWISVPKSSSYINGVYILSGYWKEWVNGNVYADSDPTGEQSPQNVGYYESPEQAKQALTATVAATYATTQTTDKLQAQVSQTLGAVSGANMVYNPGFELGQTENDSATNWSWEGDFFGAGITTQGVIHTGKWRFNIDIRTNEPLYMRSRNGMSFLKGHSYKISAWVWLDKAGEVELGIESADKKQKDSGKAMLAQTGRYNEISTYVTASADYLDAHVLIVFDPTQTNRTIRLDDVSCIDATDYTALSKRIDANKYTLPTATTSVLGGVKPDGKTITAAADGTLTAHSDNEAASFLAAYPIGSIYQSTSSSNPGSTYGGTWRKCPSQGPFIWERTA